MLTCPSPYWSIILTKFWQIYPIAAQRLIPARSPNVDEISPNTIIARNPYHFIKDLLVETETCTRETCIWQCPLYVKKCRSYLKSPPFLYFVTLGNIADITYELPTGTRPATRRAARTRTGWGSSSTKSSRRSGPTCSRRGCSSFTPGSRSTPTSETLQGCQKV